jgi:hypothetical protein
MGVLGGHGRLRRHPGVADRLVAGHGGDPVSFAYIKRGAHVLIDLDEVAKAGEADRRCELTQRLEHGRSGGLRDHDGVAASPAETDVLAEPLTQAVRKSGPIGLGRRSAERVLGSAVRGVVRVHRHPSRVRPSGPKHVKHGHDELAEAWLEFEVLEPQPHDAAHPCPHS